tara:strand:- start:4614 stop:4796 length:183 start_codon:yes stop_codon:yes gene_type:complete
MVLTIALCAGRQFIGLVLVPRGGHIVLNLTRLLACGKRAKKCTLIFAHGKEMPEEDQMGK